MAEQKRGGSGAGQEHLLPGIRPPGARILLAEDDRDLRELVVRTLEDEGYEVHAATSGKDLVWMLESAILDAYPLDGVDLILTDLRMPGPTGLEVLRELRAAHWTTPAILMTAFASVELCATAARLRVEVLSKPFPMPTLAEKIATMLEDDAEERRARATVRAPRTS